MIFSSNQEKNDHSLLSEEEKIANQQEQSSPNLGNAEQKMMKSQSKNVQEDVLEEQDRENGKSLPGIGTEVEDKKESVPMTTKTPPRQENPPLSRSGSSIPRRPPRLSTSSASPAAEMDRNPLEVERKPVNVVERKPVEVAERKPVEAAERKPVEVVERKPVNVVERKPVEVVERKPVEAVERKPVEVVERKPVEMPNDRKIVENKDIDKIEGVMERTDSFPAIKKADIVRTPSPIASEVLIQKDQIDAEDIPTVEMSATLNAVENVLLYRGQHFYVKTTIRPEKRPRRDPLRKPSGDTAMVPRILPLQKERVAESETRLMPIIDVQDLRPKNRVIFPRWVENVVVVFGVLLSIIAHAVNMFNYPRYEMDEGTYMSAAWAVLNGKIYPYAYGYGHPPFAWIQLAGLVKLVGGFFLFGNAINTGRVLMLAYTLGSTLLVYLIGRKISGSRSTAFLAMAFFAFSPMAVTYQRLVLLDNIATFWFLLSVYLLTMSRSRLSLLVLSGISFGFAMLSKEVLILVMPGMIYGVWLHATQFQRKFALVAFIYTFASVASLYLLMAILKGELFPPKWLPWDNNPQHLSLLGTLLEQTGRGQSEGKFSEGWNAWYTVDPLFMVLGLISLAFNIATGWWRRKYLLFAILAVSYWLLLVRGGVVFPFYFIPLIPMTAINIALMINTIADWIGKYVRLDMFRVALVVCIMAMVLVFDVGFSKSVYTGNLTKVQTEAMAWIRTNVPRNSYVIMNSYLYMDLRAPGGAAVGDGAVFSNAEVYINIATDPVLLNEVRGNWDRVDYIIADSQIEDYIGGKSGSAPLPTGAKFMRDAFNAAGPPCAVFTAPNYKIDVYCVKHASPRPVAQSSPNPQITLVDRRSLLA